MSTKQKGEPPNKRRSDARGNRLAKSLWPDTETGATGSVTGYGRPPARTQFKPGKSGNPAGGRKKALSQQARRHRASAIGKRFEGQ